MYSLSEILDLIECITRESDGDWLNLKSNEFELIFLLMESER